MKTILHGGASLEKDSGYHNRALAYIKAREGDTIDTLPIDVDTEQHEILGELVRF